MKVLEIKPKALAEPVFDMVVGHFKVARIKGDPCCICVSKANRQFFLKSWHGSPRFTLMDDIYFSTKINSGQGQGGSFLRLLKSQVCIFFNTMKY
jgi:hypothetical protein